MSYLLTVIQYIRSKTPSIPESRTHRYAGGTAQIRLKNRMTRHESRRPSPKVTGPSVPDANLRKGQSLGRRRSTNTIKVKEHARQDVHIRRHPYEEYFNEMCLCPILDGDRMDTYQVQAHECGSQYSAPCFLIRSIRFRIRDMIRTPRLHSPGQELLRKKTNEVGGRGCPQA
jgi:hypothetical protein